MLKQTVVLSLLAGLLLLPCTGEAALKPARKTTAAALSPADCCNPRPASDDIELPMPCGMTMVLRPVAIPVSGFLGDKQFPMGLSSTEEGRSLYEKQMAAHISAPFRQENLPAAWSGKLPADEKDAYCYYFIGKYEITRAQWAAVMEGKEVTEGGNLPVSDISWYDLQEFFRKYNEWLLSSHVDAVPRIDNVPAFLRLPTEAEWEFAARGGNLPPEVQVDNDFVLDEGRVVEDYAIFGSRYDAPMPVGSRMANTLGVYDMAGNVAEFVQGGFRFTISDTVAGGGHVRRLHGAEGGLLVKGGSFLATDEKDVYPGKRVEVQMFQKQADGSFLPYSTRSLGARVVLASINVPGMKRAMSILKEEEQLSGAVASAPKPSAQVEEQPDVQAAPEAQQAAPEKDAGAKPASRDRLVSIDLSGDPLRELEKIYGATSSPFVKSNLDQFRDLLKDVNASLTRERDANLLSSLRSAVYKADSLSNIAFRCYQLNYVLKDVKKKIPNLPAAKEKQMKEQILEHYRNLEISTNFYRLSVKEIAEYPPKDVANKILQLRKEYAGDDRLNTNFRNNLEAFAEHVEFARTQGTARLTNSMVWKRIMPAKEMLSLLSELEKEIHKKKGR